MKRILGIALFFWLASQVFAATTYFVTQGGAGSKNGSTLGNAWDMTSGSTGINNSANWSSVAGTAGKLSPDDTLSINGTITSTLTVQNSGTSGHPITLQFASGASFSKAFWGATTSGAIVGTGKSFITIDGNNVGIIEATDNGDGKTNHQFTDAIYFESSSANWIVKNLTIRTMFIHIANTANNPPLLAYNANGVHGVDSSNSEIFNCSISDVYTGILYQMTVSGTQNAPNVHDNTFFACSSAGFIAGTGPGQALDNMVWAGNDVTMGANWLDPADNNHIDGIHTSNSAAGPTYGTMTNHQVYNNAFHGDGSLNSTAPIYLTDTIFGAKVYNNRVIASTNHPAEGYIAFNLRGNCTIEVYNNTIVGLGTSNTGGNGINFSANNPSGTASVKIKNNVITSCFVAVYNPSGAVSWDSDYQTYFNLGAVGADSGGFKNTLANWQAVTGGDTHSTVSTPNLNGSGVPVATSGAIGTGVNLSTSFTTGINPSATFPNPSLLTRATTWDMGAFVVTTSGTPPTYSSGAINNLGSTLSVTYNASCTTGAGGNGGVTITASGGAVTPTYSSGSGGTTYVYTLSRTINIGETITTSYTQPGNGIEATSDGTDVASYSNQGVTNNSTQGSATSSSSVSGKVVLSGKVQIK